MNTQSQSAEHVKYTKCQYNESYCRQTAPSVWSRSAETIFSLWKAKKAIAFEITRNIEKLVDNLNGTAKNYKKKIKLKTRSWATVLLPLFVGKWSWYIVHVDELTPYQAKFIKCDYIWVCDVNCSQQLCNTRGDSTIIISYKPCGQYNAWVKPDIPSYL